MLLKAKVWGTPISPTIPAWARSASAEQSIARAMCRVREKRIPRRGSSEPSGRSSDRPEGAAPGFLPPLMIGLTTLTASCDDEDAVWPPEPREEGGSGNRRPSFKQAFSSGGRKIFDIHL